MKSTVGYVKRRLLRTPLAESKTAPESNLKNLNTPTPSFKMPGFRALQSAGKSVVQFSFDVLNDDDLFMFEKPKATATPSTVTSNIASATANIPANTGIKESILSVCRNILVKTGVLEDEDEPPNTTSNTSANMFETPGKQLEPFNDLEDPEENAEDDAGEEIWSENTLPSALKRKLLRSSSRPSALRQPPESHEHIAKALKFTHDHPNQNQPIATPKSISRRTGNDVTEFSMTTPASKRVRIAESSTATAPTPMSAKNLTIRRDILRQFYAAHNSPLKAKEMNLPPLLPPRPFVGNNLRVALEMPLPESPSDDRTAFEEEEEEEEEIHPIARSIFRIAMETPLPDSPGNNSLADEEDSALSRKRAVLRRALDTPLPQSPGNWSEEDDDDDLNDDNEDDSEEQMALDETLFQPAARISALRLALETPLPESDDDDLIIASSSAPPPPPPPPPPPAAPAPPGLFNTSAGNMTSSPTGMFLVTSIQSRLNRRMTQAIQRKRMEEVSVDGSLSTAPTKSDASRVTWLQVQARSRSMSIKEFDALAEQRKLQIEEAMNNLIKYGLPLNMAAMRQSVMTLQDAADWFPGSSKELRASYPVWRTVEVVLEEMMRFIKVTDDMKACTTEEFRHLEDIDADAKRCREVLETKKRLWGDILSSDAATWKKNGYPLEDDVLPMARGWTEQLLTSHVKAVLLVVENFQKNLSSDTMNNVEGSTIGKDIDIRRTNEMIHRVADVLSLLRETASWTGHHSATLVILSLLSATHHVNMSIRQFETAMTKAKRPQIMAHFEGCLRVLDLSRAIAGPLMQRIIQGSIKAHDIEVSTPCALDAFASALVGAALKLCDHISHSVVNDGISSPSHVQELTLWLLFACKFVHKVFQLQNKQNQDPRMKSILATLKSLETVLPGGL